MWHIVMRRLKVTKQNRRVILIAAILFYLVNKTSARNQIDILYISIHHLFAVLQILMSAARAQNIT